MSEEAVELTRPMRQMRGRVVDYLNAQPGRKLVMRNGGLETLVTKIARSVIKGRKVRRSDRTLIRNTLGAMIKQRDIRVEEDKIYRLSRALHKQTTQAGKPTAFVNRPAGVVAR